MRDGGLAELEVLLDFAGAEFACLGNQAHHCKTVFIAKDLKHGRRLAIAFNLGALQQLRDAIVSAERRLLADHEVSVRIRLMSVNVTSYALFMAQ